MARDARTTRRIKRDEAENSRRGHAKVKESATHLNASGLRRSARETSSKLKSVTQKTSLSPLSGRKMTPSPSSTRKSERLEKKIPTSSPQKRMSQGIKRPRMSSSPSTGSSSRAKGESNSTRSKKLDINTGSFLCVKQKKEKKEKGVIQLTEETKVVGSSSEEDPRPLKILKTMHTRDFKALLKRQPKKFVLQDQGEKFNAQDNSSDEASNFLRASGSGKVNQGVQHRRIEELELIVQPVERAADSEPSLTNSTQETLKDRCNLEVSQEASKDKCVSSCIPEIVERMEDSRNRDSSLLSSHGGVYEEIRNDLEKVPIDESGMEVFEPPERMDSISEGKMVDGKVLEKSNEDPFAEENGSILDVETHSSAVSTTTLLLSGNKSNSFIETHACSEGQRFGHELTETPQCCCASTGRKFEDVLCQKDRGEHEDGYDQELVGEHSKCRVPKEPPSDIHALIDHNRCFICNLGGKLLCCEGRGCGRSYHISCLDCPLADNPFGFWYCLECVKKKMRFGVHSVSQGIESIWDAREVEITNDQGSQKQKQYFVKYKGLAHVHNSWVPESELLNKAPLLLEKFSQTHQVVKWKPEWAVPQRLVQKRWLTYPKQLDENHEDCNSENLGCQYEWLVKWCGQDYDHATWELGSSAFLKTSDAEGLKSAYENRQKAKSGSPALRRKDSFIKLSQLPAGNSFGTAASYLDLVNNLREFWHKGQNALLVEESDRIKKVVQFIISLESSSFHPFLVIASSCELLVWESEFSRLRPSLNVVVYSGNPNVRRGIRMLEFCDEGARIIFQVLITTPEVIAEDMQLLTCMKWEAVIIDECHDMRTSAYHDNIKMLASDMRLILTCGPLKETTAEYHNLLSLLHCYGDVSDKDGVEINSMDSSGLKNTLSRYIVKGCNSDSPRFVEFWVPAQLSDVQLEHYCAFLLSKAVFLCASSSKDPVELGVLHDILICNRKCCDHPYLVDPSVQQLLIKDLPPAEYLDIGIKASGKLQLLDMILSEIRNRGERVLILFQSIGRFGKESIIIGDILDDFLRQRFGPDSYERVDALHSKKQVALEKFNEKSGGRFVFLLENRACAPSIKLSSIDIVIIFGSDWNPIHDLRNLQKITLKSQSEEIKVFRLYSSWTLEERILIHATSTVTVDSIHNISRSTCHKLLMWGASNLFKKLEEFHGGNNSSQESHPRYVLDEFRMILTHDDKIDSASCSVISKVKHDGVKYSTVSLSLGELGIESSDEVPHVFWTELLVAKHCPWKYVSGSSQRNRKRAHQFDDPAQKKDLESNEVAKKRKKGVNNPIAVKSPQDESNKYSGAKEGVCGTSTCCVNQLQQRFNDPRSNTCHSVQASVSSPMQCARGTNLQDVQKSLHLLMQPEVSKLCKILQLSEDVKVVVERFLEYVMNNHHVPDEPATIIQAFQISLCWTAASWLKQKIDHKESLALAKEHLHYACSEEEAERVFSKLRCLKTIFLVHTGYLKVSGASISTFKDASGNNICGGLSQPALSELHSLEIDSLQHSQDGSIKNNFPLQRASIIKMVERDISKSLKKIQKKSKKWMSKLLRSQQEELKELRAFCEEEKALLEKSHKLEAAVIRLSHESNGTMRTDKLKNLNDDYRKKYEDQKRQWELRLENLAQVQLAMREREQQRAVSWQEEVKSWADLELLNKLCSDDPGSSAEDMQNNNRKEGPDGLNNLAHASECASRKTRPDVIELVDDADDHRIIAESVTHGAVMCREPTEAVEVRLTEQTGSVSNVTASKSLIVIDECNKSSGSVNSGEQISLDACPQAQVSNGGTATVPDSQKSIQPPIPFGSDACQDNLVGTDLSLHGKQNSNTVTIASEEQASDGIVLNVSCRECQLRVSENSRSRNAEENLLTDFPEAHIPNDVMPYVPPGDVPEKVPEFAASSHIEENLTSEIPYSASQHPEGMFSAAVSETPSSTLGLIDVVSINRPSFEVHCPDDCTAPSGRISSGLTMTVNAGEGAETFTSGVPTLVVSSCPQDILSVNPSRGEQDPVSITLGVCDVENPEMPVVANVVEGGNAVAEGGRGHSIATETPGAAEVTQDRADGAISQDSCFQAPEDKDSTPSKAGSMPGEDVEATEMYNPSQQTESPHPCSYNAECGNLSPCEAQVTAPVIATGTSLSASVAAGELIPDQANQEALVTEPNEHLRMEVSTPLPVDVLSSERSIYEGTVPESLHLSPTGETEVCSSGNNFGPSQIGQASLQQLSESTQSHSTNIRTPNASRLPVCWYLDPLHNELERIRKETEQRIKLHEEMMLQLKSDCKKEIEQVRQKYESKIQVVQAEFVSKKKEMDMNQKKVLMNKFLAEAFRSKCMDRRMCSAPAVQQDMASNNGLPVTRRQSAQQTPQWPNLAVSLSPGPSESSLPSSASLCLQQGLTPTISSMTPASTMSGIHHSSGLLISVPPRHSQVNPVPPPASFQTSSEIRAPAPHLQSFRPPIPMTMGLPLHICPSPYQMAHNNIPAASPLISQLPSEILPNQLAHNNPLATSPLPARIPSQNQMQTHQVAPCNGPQESETGWGLPSLPSMSLPPLPLVMDALNGQTLNYLDNLPSFVNMGSDFDSAVQIDISTESNVQAASTHPNETDIVCLSDDD